MSLKERSHQARKEYLLCFRNTAISEDKERDAKAQNQIIKRATKEKQTQMGFRHVTNDMRRGRHESLKQLQDRRN